MKKTKDSKKHPITVTVCLIAFNILLIGICGYLWSQAMKLAVSEVEETYESRREEVLEDTTQKYYEWAFQTAEEKYHSSSRAIISVGNIQEEARLEVLRVSDVEFVVHDENEDEIKRWLAIPGEGVFTVDMTESEFLIDDVRQTVIARLPEPRLTSDRVESKDIEIYELKKRGLNGNYSTGISAAEKDVKEGQEKIRNAFLSDQEYLISAEKSAELIIRNLILNLNPDAEDLKVVVEFVN